MTDACQTCRQPADEIELAMYDGRCEQCERKNHTRIQAWRAGADDAVLDMFWRSFGPPLQ